MDDCTERSVCNGIRNSLTGSTPPKVASTMSTETLPQESPSPEAWAEQFLESLQAERERVREFLAANRVRLERAEAALEAEIERLEQRVEAAEAQPSAPRVPVIQHRKGAPLDWEAEKRRILAALEAGYDPRDPQQETERVRIEEVIETTEQALAEKDRQIEQLTKRLAELDDHAANGHQQASDEQLLNADTLIQQERQRLKELQEQWQEKLRLAEIEVSLQRAKVARDRAELEERIRLAECAIVGPVGTPAERQKRPRGRWLARLGLTEADRDDGTQDS